MEITYLARRYRDGKYYCHDVEAAGLRFNLFLSAGASIEKIMKHAEDWLENPFPEHRKSDSITVLIPEPIEEPLIVVEEVREEKEPYEETKKIPVFPEGKPSMAWRVVEIQDYMAAYEIDYSDGDTKAEMLAKIKGRFAA